MTLRSHQFDCKKETAVAMLAFEVKVDKLFVHPETKKKVKPDTNRFTIFWNLK
jgi:hypothetical protein